jgi:hypothetical protein
MTTDEKALGLLPKYTVERNNDPDGKHDICRYFVLDPKHDPIARSVLTRYADEARQSGYVALADDLDAWVTSLWESEEAGRPCD